MVEESQKEESDPTVFLIVVAKVLIHCFCCKLRMLMEHRPPLEPTHASHWRDCAENKYVKSITVWRSLQTNKAGSHYNIGLTAITNRLYISLLYHHLSQVELVRSPTFNKTKNEVHSSKIIVDPSSVDRV